MKHSKTFPQDNYQSSSTPCIGILRETSSHWERRAVLTPESCKQLTEKGIRIIVQPSNTRCYSESEYIKAGAEISEDLTEANVIVGVQPPSLNNLLPKRTYMFFSYTCKGQTNNGLLLQKIFENKIRLIDYQCIRETTEDGKRLVSFGRIAGIAGTINILKGIGELLLSRNMSTPFIFTKLSYMYPRAEDAKKALRCVSKFMQEGYLPESVSPFVFGILGDGQVASGVREALESLNHEYIQPEELHKLVPGSNRDKIYIVVFKLEHIYELKEPKILNGTNSSTFNKTHFIKHPDLYKVNFIDNYLQYISCIVNCLYWEPFYPPIITKRKLKDYIVNHHTSKLLAICDISCDLNGSIDILDNFTNYRNPFFIYEPVLETKVDNVDHSTKEGIIYHAVQNLAASFSFDASELFSKMLLSYVEELAFSKYIVQEGTTIANEDDIVDLSHELRNATIASSGVLTPKFRYIFKDAEERKRSLSDVNKNYGRPYFISMKLVGHLFDSNFFIKMINEIPKNDLAHKVNLLEIGHKDEEKSILYLDIFAHKKDGLVSYLENLEKEANANEIDLNLIKSNIY